MTPIHVTSSANRLLVQVRRLTRDPGAYRRTGRVWLEGDKLCSALRARGLPALQAIVSEDAWADAGKRALAEWADEVVIVPAALFAGLSALESAADMGFVLTTPAAPAIDANAASVVLDRVQDAGNVGSILRSASALGARQVLALQGTAALWSSKVLRAGMGAHFGLRLIEGLSVEDLSALHLPLVATSSHAKDLLHAVTLPTPCAWVFGHEGQGVAPELMARCALTVRIGQPGGEESLNVAAAAAICLHESARSA